MTHPGSDAQPPAAQPGPQPAPPGAPGAPGQPGPYAAWDQPQGGPVVLPPKRKGAKKWLSAAGTVVIVGGLGLARLTGNFGLGDPEVGDCIKPTGNTSFDVVDCDSSDAQYRVVGVQDKKLTYPDFLNADVCTDFAATEVALWTGDEVTEEGTVYCAASI